MIRNAVQKLIDGQTLSPQERMDLLQLFDRLEVIRGIESVKMLDEVAYDLGDIIAGRHISSANPSNNNPDSPTFTGTYMDENGVTGKNSGTTQFQLSSTDGKATAGGGQVILDENGVSVLVSDAFYEENAYKFVDGSGNTVGYMSCTGDPTYKSVAMQARPVTGQSSYLFLKSDCPTSKASGIEIFADYNSAGTTPARIYLFNNGTPTIDLLASTITFDGTPAGQIAPIGYTPTLTNTTNISSSTAQALQGMRVGNYVTISGAVDATPTATGQCVLSMSIPLASTFTAQGQLGGTGVTSSYWPVYIRASTSAYNAVFVWNATSTTAQTIYFSFGYKIV